ncbi:MAG TPA: hypothetical protein VIB49_01970 [Thermoplasmata archaeon]
MQVGCGLYELEVKGRRYLYFWHYETRGGRRIQVKEYVGPARLRRSREDGARRCDAYFRRSAQELEKMRAIAIAPVLP